MTIATGKRFGPYEILSSVGAGGMGEVYRARDTRLDRVVAIKVLPNHLTSNAELRPRFVAERPGARPAILQFGSKSFAAAHPSGAMFVEGVVRRQRTPAGCYVGLPSFF